MTGVRERSLCCTVAVRGVGIIPSLLCIAVVYCRGVLPWCIAVVLSCFLKFLKITSAMYLQYFQKYCNYNYMFGLLFAIPDSDVICVYCIIKLLDKNALNMN